MMTTKFSLERDQYRKLVMTDTDGVSHYDVRPVRAFPIQSPQQGISLVLENGQEVAWIDDMNDIEMKIRDLINEELNGREFMPEISRIVSVTSFATPCTWHVETDRGTTQFVLKGDEDIRRIGKDSLLIADNHGIQFLIRDMFGIDKHSRKILDRFL